MRQLKLKFLPRSVCCRLDVKRFQTSHQMGHKSIVGQTATHACLRYQTAHAWHRHQRPCVHPCSSMFCITCHSCNKTKLWHVCWSFLCRQSGRTYNRPWEKPAKHGQTSTTISTTVSFTSLLFTQCSFCSRIALVTKLVYQPRLKPRSTALETSADTIASSPPLPGTGDPLNVDGLRVSDRPEWTDLEKTRLEETNAAKPGSPARRYVAPLKSCNVLFGHLYLCM